MMEAAIEQARFFIALALAVAFLLLLIGAADAADLPQGYSCEQVRSYVAEHGKWRALIDAKLHGATREQIRQARECLHKP